MVRLITHNLLACHAGKCSTSNSFPLSIVASAPLVERETEFNEAFLKGFLPKLEWHALLQAAKSLGIAEGLPENAPELDGDGMQEGGDFWKTLHRVLLEVFKCYTPIFEADLELIGRLDTC